MRMRVLNTILSVLSICSVINALVGPHHHKLYNGSHLLEKPWEALREVDGLKNEDIVMLVSSSATKKYTYLRGRILPSLRTWMKMLANVFVIVEDTFQARYAMRHCSIRETQHFTSFDCPHEPTYVLSRKCLPTKGGGPGPCCKVDELMTYLIYDRPDVYSHTRFALHCDDDTYFRVDQVMRFLAMVENSGVNTYPIVGSPNGNDPKENIYSIMECDEVHTNGWYQPFMINRAGMERAKVGFAAYGTMETCNNFIITHDVGMGPFFWMFGMYHIKLPGTTVSNHDVHIGPIITHAVKHGGKIDDCDNITNYGDAQKYNQKILLGCGTIDEAMSNHHAGELDYNGQKQYNDMYDLWNHWKVKGEDQAIGLPNPGMVTLWPPGTMIEGISIAGDENKVKVKHIIEEWEKNEVKHNMFQGDSVVMHPIPALLQLRGYNTTKHSRENDITKVWKNFGMKDCAVPGVKGFKKNPK